MSFWNTREIEWNDLPTVRKLLRDADINLLTRVFVEENEQTFFSADGTNFAKSKKQITRLVNQSIADMRVHKIRKSKDVCIFPLRCFRFDPCSTTMHYSIDPWAITKGMMGLASAQLENSPALASANDLRKFRVTSQSAKFIELPFERFAPVALPFESWKDVLGYRVWLGGDFSRKERYMALASIVLELTYFGFLEKDAVKRRRKFERDILDFDDGNKKKGKGKKNQEAHELEGKRPEKKEKLYPEEVVVKDFGLEAPPDDFDSEYASSAMDLECIISHNELLAMCQQIANLDEMLKRGYREE